MGYSLIKKWLTVSVAATSLLGATAALAQSTYKIAVAGPLTGAAASYGEELRRGAQHVF